MACERTDWLLELIENLDNLPDQEFNTIIDHISSPVIAGLPKDERKSIWETLVGVVNKHRKFSNAKWAMSPDLIDKIEDVTVMLTPKNLQDVFGRLFTDREHLLFESKEFEEERKKFRAEMRQRFGGARIGTGRQEQLKAIEAIEGQVAKLKAVVTSTAPGARGSFRDLSQEERAKLRDKMTKLEALLLGMTE